MSSFNPSPLNGQKNVYLLFTGTFIVVPNVNQLGLPGNKAELIREASKSGANAATVVLAVV